MGNNILLDICIYTYNRKDILIADIINYLQCTDNRFRIVIQDNASNDGTQDEITKIKDSRLLYRRNHTNLGALPNAIKALSGNDAEYSMVVIDKDLIQIKELPAFLDFLEKQNPAFGYVNLSIEKENQTLFYEKGYDAASNLGFLCNHPSGYFYKSKLWDKVTNQFWFKSIPTTFDFPFDNVAGALAFYYDGVVYGKPLIRNANYRNFPTEGKTLTYNEDNFYFSPKIVIKTMKNFLTCVFANKLQYKLKKRICKIILFREAGRVTFGYKLILTNKNVCEHYGLQMRNLSFLDMYKYLNQYTTDFVRFSESELTNFDLITFSIEVKARFIFSFIKRLVKRLIKKYVCVHWRSLGGSRN